MLTWDLANDITDRASDAHMTEHAVCCGHIRSRGTELGGSANRFGAESADALGREASQPCSTGEE